MEQLELEKQTQQLNQTLNNCIGDYEKQTTLYRELTFVLERLNTIYKEQIENLKRQIK